MDAMSRALHRAAQSPFSEDIEWAPIRVDLLDLYLTLRTGRRI